MRAAFAAFACALCALAIAGPAGAGVSVGVNDDSGKYADGAPQFWETMKQNGLRQNAVTVLWDETRPTTIVDEGFIRNALPAAEAAGIDVVFDVYPMHSQAFTRNGATAQQFADFLTLLAQTFPTVTQYVVMNECNQTRFVNPQFDADGVNQSAAICGKALAAGYDALKAVDPAIVVWGVGLSPRGNDNAQAASNVSTSPVKFLAALGQWYRSSGRTQPLMDGFDFHPYPIPQSLPFAVGYAAENNAAVSNLPRIYQAFYDAFRGTAQPTIGQQAGGGLPVSLNEVGVQTDNTGRPGYTGTEVSGDANGGVRGDTGTEAFQASWYLQMLNTVACDPNVEVVNLFHLVDETALEGWQSGLYYADYTPKASAAAVSGWIARTGGECAGTSKPWMPAGVPAASGGSAFSDADPRTLLAQGVFGNLGAGSAGDLSRYLTRADAARALRQLFRLGTSFGGGTTSSSFTDLAPSAWLSGYLATAQAATQPGVMPNLQPPAQRMIDLLSLVLGPLPSSSRLTASLVACGASCSPSALARQALAQALCASLGVCARSTASATALRPVAVGSATAHAGKPLRVRMKAVRGAKRAYGRYALVLRFDAAKGSVRPAALAVSFNVAKAAKSGATEKRAAPGKSATHGKSAKPKPDRNKQR
jgi:hypothetical protein